MFVFLIIFIRRLFLALRYAFKGTIKKEEGDQREGEGQ
jgi:hypothetical protein